MNNILLKFKRPLQSKQSKHFLAVLFITLLPSITFAQFLEAKEEVVEFGRSANGGEYDYRATVKARANNPGKMRLGYKLL
ncbi:hypothetical protein V6R21_10120 [Limibacter armeniacum]|uniref:hypothetical protein n=1 Tax=Limibacter armeniacum TaxID=466084 RepID=UPI002FE52CC1